MIELWAEDPATCDNCGALEKRGMVNIKLYSEQDLPIVLCSNCLETLALGVNKVHLYNQATKKG